MRAINEIIIHCSSTPEGRNTVIEDIDRWHRAKGWKGVGYHFVIHLDGSIHKGRDEKVMGSHCVGKNRNSIGICYIGGLAKDKKTPKDTRTEAQKQALIKLIAELKKKYPGATVYGHKDFASKACPCFDAETDWGKV